MDLWCGAYCTFEVQYAKQTQLFHLLRNGNGNVNGNDNIYFS